jgi:hypothetical protein
MLKNPRFLGKKHSEETKQKMRLAALGENNHRWKGDDISYRTLHQWINRHKPKPELCEICCVEPPYDAACVGEYDRNLDNWKYVCRSCHVNLDGRIYNLRNQNNDWIIYRTTRAKIRFENDAYAERTSDREYTRETK